MMAARMVIIHDISVRQQMKLQTGIERRKFDMYYIVVGIGVLFYSRLSYIGS